MMIQLPKLQMHKGKNLRIPIVWKFLSFESWLQGHHPKNMLSGHEIAIENMLDRELKEIVAYA
jgi:hypothetical protein